MHIFQIVELVHFSEPSRYNTDPHWILNPEPVAWKTDSRKTFATVINGAA